MINLIKMNFYRMFYSKSMWVLMIIPMILCAGSMFWLNSEMKEEPETFFDGFVSGWKDAEEEDKIRKQVRAELGSDATEEEIEAEVKQRLADKIKQEIAEQENGNKVEISVGVNPEHGRIGESGIIGYVWNDYASGMLTLFLTIATVIFVNAESNTGFIKNLTSQKMSRSNVFFAKLIVIYIYYIMMLALWFLISAIGILLVYKGDVAFGVNILSEALAGIGINYLLSIAFASGVAVLTTLTKSTALSLSVSILVDTGFVNMFYFIIEEQFDVEIAKYLTMPTLNEVVEGAGKEVFLRGFWVGICFLVLYNVIGALWVTKRDVV